MTDAGPVQLSGVSDLAGRFDAFLVDQFGVLHDGINAYPGAVDALARLKDSGATIALLSNSGKRAEPNARRMLSLGFKPGSWDHFISSGEVAFRRLATSLESRSGRQPLRCLFLSRGGDTSAVDGLPIELVETGTDAELVILSGSETDLFDEEHYHRLLAPAAAREIECICTNPDKIMLTERGPRPGAGALADSYAAMGGPVTWIGKPYPEIYQAARELEGFGRQSRIACVGDSIEHDIAGGSGAGLATVVVTTGVLASATEAERAELFAHHGATPDYVMHAFSW